MARARTALFRPVCECGAQVVEGLTPADMVTKQVNELAELPGP